ncbi:MAG: hypothetical protein LIO93_04755 [Bacteroidales bacterium]|nr:hypothetical protein [Bacteroidales bacterium]
MIIQAKIISQPQSGEYSERIYNIESPWNSQNWTWIKFTNEDLSEWCGIFRGDGNGVGISFKHNLIMVLTWDYLFLLDRVSGNIVEYERMPQYHSLTVSPLGDFILGYDYWISKYTTDLKNSVNIKSRSGVEFIKVLEWMSGWGEFTCDEFPLGEKHFLMEYDCETDKIAIISE